MSFSLRHGKIVRLTYTYPYRRLIARIVILASLAVLIVLLWHVDAYACDRGEKYCASTNGCIPVNEICLLEPPPGGGGSVVSGANMAAFFNYVNGGIWQWAFMIGVGIAVLHGTIAGFQIILSNGDSSQIAAGRQRFMYAAIGLALLLLSGVILKFLNPAGFDIS